MEKSDKKIGKNGPLKVLFAGESWVTHSIHIKGFDTFTTNEYAEGGTFLIRSLEQNKIHVDFLPNHLASREFPLSIDEVSSYHVIILSDIGSNTLLIHPDSFAHSQCKANRLELLSQYVQSGGGLAMVGGYMSFSGVDGKARYQKTALARVLPVIMMDGDDRIEVPQGAEIEIVSPSHPILSDISVEWPKFLGYNQLKSRPDAHVLARCGEDVFLSVMEYGKGRSLAFASDCGPHWGPTEFVEWEHYGRFWSKSVEWLAKRC